MGFQTEIRGVKLTTKARQRWLWKGLVRRRELILKRFFICI